MSVVPFHHKANQALSLNMKSSPVPKIEKVVRPDSGLIASITITSFRLLERNSGSTTLRKSCFSTYRYDWQSEIFQALTLARCLSRRVQYLRPTQLLGQGNLDSSSQLCEDTTKLGSKLREFLYKF